MGCLKALFVQVGCLVLVAAGAVLGFIYRDQVGAAYRKVRGLPPRAEVVYSAPLAGDGERARTALERLGRRGGPAYVDLTAAELASLVDVELARAPSRVFDSVMVGLDEGALRLRGRLDLSSVPQRLLGPLSSGLDRRERVEAGGPLLVDTSGRVLWRITSLKVRDFPFPRGTIPAIIRALRIAGAEDGAVPLPTPGRVGDVRVTPSAVRLYRSSPQ